MLDLEELLGIEKNRSNKNPKFPSNPNAPTVFSRLGFNYTFPDPSIIELSDSAKDHLDRMPKLLKDWQAEDMRNNNAKDYYFNPVGSAASLVQSVATDIVKSSEYIEVNLDNFLNPYTTKVVSGLEDVHDSANVLSSYAGSFKLHTDRLSNVVALDVGEALDPHYLTCSALGRSVLYIVNETDNIQDARPILGSFTSLFESNNIIQLSNRIADYPKIVEDSITIEYPMEGDPNTAPTYSSNLSPSMISTIVEDLNALSSVMGSRMWHDKNFWENSKKIHDEFSQFKVMNQEGETQKKLVNTIGTQKLKQSLLIADLPVETKYDVKIDYFGNVEYKPNTAYQYQVDANSPITIVDSYIDFYSNNELIITGPVDDSGNSAYNLQLSNGAIDLTSINGMWSNTKTITILNLANTPYIFSGVDTSDFENIEFQYEFSPANTNVILSGQYITFNVSARSVATTNGTEYGVLKIVPGIEFQSRFKYSIESTVGILSPSSIYNVFGSNTSKLLINTNNGPYRILANTSLAPDYYTWINNSDNPVTISTIEDITPTANASDLTITLVNANTETLNVGSKVLWYANIVPNVTSPNNSLFKVTTEDGQERIITIGIYGGVGNEGTPGDGVDDSSLYNEIITTNPEEIYANGTPFSINVTNGKPLTQVSYTGPDLSGIGLISANGNFSVYNSDGISVNGYYTYTFTFAGTGHSRTITKAIFAS